MTCTNLFLHISTDFTLTFLFFFFFLHKSVKKHSRAVVLKRKFHVVKYKVPHKYDNHNNFYPDFNPSNIILTSEL